MNSPLKKWIGFFSTSKTISRLRDPSWLVRMKTPNYQKWIIGIVTALAITFILSPSFHLGFKEINVGDIATKEVKSAQDLLVEDEKSTREKGAEAEKAVLSVYDFDPSVLTDAEARIRSAFQKVTPPPRGEKGSDKSLNPRSEMEATLRLSFTSNEWTLLERKRFNPSIGEAALKLITPLLKKGVVTDKDALDPDGDKGVIIRDIHTRVDRKDLPPFDFLDIREAKGSLRTQSEQFHSTLGIETGALALKLAEHLLKPNLTFNKDETEDRKMKAREMVNPVYFQVKRGEVVLRAGDRVREDHLAIINALRKVQERSHVISILIGMCLLTFLLLASIYQFSTKNIRKVTLSQKDILFFSTALVGTMAVLKLFQVITDVLGTAFVSIPSSSYLYLFPIAAGAMLVRIVINSEVATLFSILVGYFSAVLMGNQLSLFIFAFVGSIIGAHKVAQCEQRNTILKAGLMVGAANALMVFSITLLSSTPFKITLVADLVFGFLGGILASILVLGTTPIVESLFSYTTDIKLLELASMDNLLIKDLILQAPGTYHHSMIVGSLAEAAAKAVSANPLLARVSSYYHDIGKLKKPLYFIENAGGGENKHDHLTPTMSSLILLSHIKDGLELARENRLGGRVAHIIQQHHGTSLISYFYQKAKEQAIDPLNDEDFRYPGPKPQTKEAGLVMLADAVEAASRALSDPNPSRIKSLVQRIISDVFLDGQLEECELTLKDLHKIEDSFTHILNAIFHQRIDYPSASPSEAAKKRNDEDLDSKSAKTVPFKLRKSKKGGPTDLGRVGIS
ncbi:MAG: metal dependent phosphohydrolase [Deltaproteobacteria bacterium]|nr:metal dependent phosphohydrolase [Deltaproteobacteria bacterium]